MSAGQYSPASPVSEPGFLLPAAGAGWGDPIHAYMPVYPCGRRAAIM